MRRDSPLAGVAQFRGRYKGRAQVYRNRRAKLRVYFVNHSGFRIGDSASGVILSASRHLAISRVALNWRPAAMISRGIKDARVHRTSRERGEGGFPILSADGITRLADVTTKIVTSGFCFFDERDLNRAPTSRRIDDAANWSGLNRAVFIPEAKYTRSGSVPSGRESVGLEKRVNSIELLAKCFLRVNARLILEFLSYIYIYQRENDLIEDDD